MITPEMQREFDRQYAIQLDNVTKDFGGGVKGLDDVKLGFRTSEITVLLVFQDLENPPCCAISMDCTPRPQVMFACLAKTLLH